MATVLAGCGNSRTPVPNVLAPASPGGFRVLALPSAGITLRAPRSWTVTMSHAPLVAVMTSGLAVVALWRYPRTLPPPSGTALEHARQALIAAARARDPGLEVLTAKTTTIAGKPAIELDVLDHVHGQARRVFSTHLFLARAELVLDEYAPPQLFAAVSRAVFMPVAQSLFASSRAIA